MKTKVIIYIKEIKYNPNCLRKLMLKFFKISNELFKNMEMDFLKIILIINKFKIDIKNSLIKVGPSKSL